MMRLRAQCRVIVLATLLVTTAAAQVFRVQGGQSTLLNAEGGSVEFKAPNYDGTIGLGAYNGKFAFGMGSRYLFRGYTWLAGDSSVPFRLPTDVFDGSHYFSARGLGVTRDFGSSRLYALVGTTSTMLGTGFFNAATSDRAAAIFFYERKLNPRWRFFSREVFSTRQTALQGLEWKVRPGITAAFTGGLGSNQGYLASSFEAETRTLGVRASYVLAGNSFRRVTVLSPLSSEINKGNIQTLYKPNEFMSFTVGHENILQPVTAGGALQQASVDQLSSDFHVARFYFGSGFFRSSAEGRRTKGTNLYVGRRIGRRLETNLNWFQSSPEHGEKSTILSATVRETFSDRFSLLQLISRTEGQTTFSLGGDFTSNRLLLHAGYQNIYLPLRPDHPFQQALALNATVRVYGPLQFTVATDVAPDGRLRYSFGASTYLYRVRGLMLNAQSPDTFTMGKYVVQGSVKDEQGLPVEGAALRIGRELVYTDSLGHFLARLSRRGPFALSVPVEEFLSSRRYEVVSAPSVVKADTDESAAAIEVVVRLARAAVILTR